MRVHYLSCHLTAQNAPVKSCCVWKVSAEACSMQRMSSFRQQTHYELLGLSFLVVLSENLPSLDPLELLSVLCKASQEDIRVAYKRLALVWHPDRNPHCDRRVAQDKFQAIQQAYSVLSRPERRQVYHLECLDCWDMKEYLTNFRDLVLTPSGLGLQPYSAERMLAGIRHPVPLLLAA